jgi:serine O-acetyltransferase
MGSIAQDFPELLKAARAGNEKIPAWRAFLLDGFALLLLTRLREGARRWHIPLVNFLLRRVQMIVYGIELGNGVQLGPGVYFVHSLGTVLGGDCRIGARVRFMGNNTVGTAAENGYPVIGDDVLVGCGARVLGPIRVGARSVIGANAVVLEDVPEDSVAIGVPAIVRPRK